MKPYRFLVKCLLIHKPTHYHDYRIGEVNRLCNHAILLANNQQPVQAMDTLKLAIQKLRPEMPDGLKLLAYTQYARVSRDAGKPRQALQYYRKAMSYQNTTHNKANIAKFRVLIWLHVIP